MKKNIFFKYNLLVYKEMQTNTKPNKTIIPY